MDTREKLTTDLKQAMRDKNTVALETIRGVRAAILNREVENGSDLDEQEILKVIRSLVKQRNDSIEQYLAGGRQDLADREQEERTLLEAYLPAAPDEAIVRKVVAEVVAELSASSMKDMGRVMSACKERLGPAVDGKLLSGAVKQALSA